MAVKKEDKIRTLAVMRSRLEKPVNESRCPYGEVCTPLGDGGEKHKHQTLSVVAV